MNYQRIVIKLGTSTLTAGTLNLSQAHIVDLVRQMAVLHSNSCDIVLVSSGAIASGREWLRFPPLTKDIPIKQMLAAVGQPRLMNLYTQLFGLYNLKIGQVLLTSTDLANRRHYLNSRNTLSALISQKVVPIVNENDTVATEEIRFGDNDNLAAMVVNLIDADLLILLTDQPGLFTTDPNLNPHAQLIDAISSPDIPIELWQSVGGTSNELGTGGMFTKLKAADLARKSGATVVIARGSDPDVLVKIFNGKKIGTCFLPVATSLESRKRFLLAGGREIDRLVVDIGASQALFKGGSLLPVGVIEVEGSFDRGDVVRVIDPQEREIAHGLTNYTSHELNRIRGHHSGEIDHILGYDYGEEVIHRNNMVLL